MAPRVNGREGVFHERNVLKGVELGGASLPIGNATGMTVATMDQSDIRGLVTACHRSIAGLSLSNKRRSPFKAPT